MIVAAHLPKGSTLGIWKIVSRLESRSAAAPDAVATPAVLGSKCPGWQGKVASSGPQQVRSLCRGGHPLVTNVENYVVGLICSSHVCDAKSDAVHSWLQHMEGK